MTYAETMAIITPIAFSIAINAVPYLDGRKVQRRVVAGITVAFAIVETLLLFKVFSS